MLRMLITLHSRQDCVQDGYLRTIESPMNYDEMKAVGWYGLVQAIDCKPKTLE